MEKALMTGNEAIARGAWEAGCHVAVGYPGTPSTEILENVVKYPNIHTQWCVNEKVAAEEADGVSAAGGRAIVTMKVVGLNVAMDPLMTMSYLGTRGGLVFVVADDPGAGSSQTEQDNRYIAKFANMPLLEPSDSQECKEFIGRAFELSEQFGQPAMVRLTTHVCHSKSVVTLEDRKEVPIKPYEKTDKYCSNPAMTLGAHQRIIDMLPDLEAYSNACDLNREEWNGPAVGIVTSGVSYQHAKEVFGDKASYFKIGLSNRLPMARIKDFASRVEKLYVIEENDPFIEDQMRAEGLRPIGREKLPHVGNLTPEIIRKALLGQEAQNTAADAPAAPPRPAVLCAGCPHRSIFYEVSKVKNAVAANDIGCYTLGMVAPLSVTDTIFCMGAGISAGLGMERVFRMTGQNKKVFGFIGDSTFFHSGITGLIDAVWNGSNIAVCILDNRTTGMTGHQENPGTGHTLAGDESPMIDIAQLVRSIGVAEDHIREVASYDLEAVKAAVKDAAESQGVFVIISKQPCALLKSNRKARAGMGCEVDQDKCRHCRKCLSIGCPAVIIKDGITTIDRDQCNGCTLCAQVCPFDAIQSVKA
jgi:indolepyruvate ferredoxin oxidoreductase alpha subunit